MTRLMDRLVQTIAHATRRRRTRGRHRWSDRSTPTAYAFGQWEATQ
ncbi:hypothetical protein C8E86_0478 [Catellatospora citrea]|nr:hypothetical protein C8E86_0478 [Catellatospora citrea]